MGEVKSGIAYMKEDSTSASARQTFADRGDKEELCNDNKKSRPQPAPLVGI
jgi:hypothetical protein